LNLDVNDAAMLSRDAVSFFGLVQKISCFSECISPSLVSNEEARYPTHSKTLSDTRWESRMDSIRSFRYRAGEIYDTLYDISKELSYDPITRNEAELLASHMKSLKFLCSTVIWYNILNKVNIATKVLQNKK
jgi:hypothetical protein